MLQPPQAGEAGLPKEHRVPQKGWQQEEREARAGNANYAEIASTCSSPALGPRAGESQGTEHREEPLPSARPAQEPRRMPRAGRVQWEAAPTASMEGSGCNRLHSSGNETQIAPHPASKGRAAAASMGLPRGDRAAPELQGWGGLGLHPGSRNHCPRRCVYLPLGRLLPVLAEPLSEQAVAP